MPITVWHYPNCSTCRRALKWLDGRAIAAQRVHIVDSPPSADQLLEILSRSGLPVRRLFNTSGVSYRAGDFKSRLPGMTDAQACAALAADGKLIKRPLVDAGAAGVLVGFKEADWAVAFGVQ